ncbi:MAG: hypothetical protein AAF791_00465 [Bacteroidota bacterium]
MHRFLLPLLALAACAEAPVEMPPHEAAADALLEHVTGNAWDSVWTRAAAADYVRLGTEAGTSEALDAPPVNPLPAFLSDEPPYLDTAAREQYATRVLGDTTVAGRPAQLVEALFVPDGRRTQPIRLVRAAVTESGDLLWVHVDRAMDTILFDEASRLRAGLTEADGALVPGHAEIETTTDVTASEPRPLTLAWERVR